jgi:putative oxidoreductase
MIAGTDRWQELGARMALVGIDFLPVAWGFLCAFSEFAGGIALTVGIFVRPFSASLFLTMTVALIFLLSQNAPYAEYSHPLKLMIVFITFSLVGGGRYSIDKLLTRKWSHKI